MESATNGWQNMGIMFDYSFQNIPQKRRDTFMVLCRFSFGYGNRKTLHRNVDFWAGKTGLSKNTFVSQVTHLVHDGHIKQIKGTGFVVGGGKIPYAYAPTFPKKAKIWFNDKKKEEPDITAWRKEDGTISKTKRGIDEALRSHRETK